MDFSISRWGRFLERCHRNVDEAWVPICGLPKKRIQNDGDAEHDEALGRANEA